TNTVEAVIDVSPIPVDVAITPDGSRAYVLSTLFDEFSLIDTSTHEVDETAALGDGRRVIFSPNGELAYLLGSEMISVIRTETNTIEAAIPENGCDMALTPDGRFLYVQDYTFETGDLVVYDTATLTPVETVSDIGGCGIAIAAKPPSIDVDIDIKPGGSGNSVNPKSQQRIPVAILTTQSFDAVHVDPASVVFGPGAAREAHGRGHVEDVDRDGDPDLLLHFDVRDAGIRCGDTRAALHGETFDGLDVSGSDSIRTVSCK
ncbi:MAG: hypothetical protein JXB36_19650, partial [Gammaproteobacteria bacterium]|nr:hypothetical protein [Gammaproteobacteria bacterium]